MPKYSREHEYDLEDELNDNNTQPPAQTEQSAVEKTWEKRYGDLRRHTQAEINALKEELRNSTSAPQEATAPKTPQEVAAWMRKFPDVANVIRSMIMDEVSGTRNEVRELKTETVKQRKERAKQEAQAALAADHPDFFNDIINREDFHEWINTKSQAMQDALFVNETDATRASEVITLYKLETGNKKREKTDKRDVASDVPTRGTPSVGNDPHGRTFKESDIDRMSGAEYEANETAIELARRENRIIYDLSGAAR